jgi:pimeloyl-ACP methyl ester carboxylesterase
MGWSAVRRGILAGAASAAWVGALDAQSPRRDSTAVRVTGSGDPTYVLLSGLVGGVVGFRRLASVLERDHRVIVIDPYRLAVDSADVTFAALARGVDAVLAEYGVDSARVVGHAHGAGVALRLAASSPRRVAALYFLDVGALEENRTKVFSSSLRLVPLIARLPGGRGFVRGRYVRGLRQNAGRQEWLDSATVRAYTDPFLNNLSKVVAMAGRLSRAREPESRLTLVSRVRVPLTLLLGAVPHPAQPDSAELEVLAPLGSLLRIERLEGVGHFPHEEATAKVAEYLRAPVVIPSEARNPRLVVIPNEVRNPRVPDREPSTLQAKDSYRPLRGHPRSE